MHVKYSLVLITVDCLRADHVGFLGYDRATTPFLDGLACESLVFEKAVVAGVPTYYSFPAILAARSPIALGRDVVGLAPEEPALAPILKQQGCITGAFIAGNPYLSHRFGYHRGFETFQDFIQYGVTSMLSESDSSDGRMPFRRRANQLLEGMFRHWGVTKALYNELYFHYCQWVTAQRLDGGMATLRRYPAADVVVDRALDWLRGVGRRPFFLWLHLMDPHHPYYPPEEALAAVRQSNITPRRALYLNSMWNRGAVTPRRLGRYREEVIGLYDAGIRWVDMQIARLVGMLRKNELWDETVFVVTSDHGEEFLEHGGRYHSPFKLTEELIRVPLLIRIPGGKTSSRVESLFSLLHLVPTLLEIVEVPVPDGLQGHGFWPALQAGQAWDQAAVTECVYGCTNPWRVGDRIGPRLLAVRDVQYKLVLDFGNQREQFFDLAADPAEHNPLSESEQRRVRRRLLEQAYEHLRRSGKQQDSRGRLRARLADIRHRLMQSMAPHQPL